MLTIRNTGSKMFAPITAFIIDLTHFVKSIIPETLNLLTCAYSSKDIKKSGVKVSCVRLTLFMKRD